MKAVIWTRYGSPEGLSLQEVDQPIPKENEILIKIHAATVTAGDCEIRRMQLPLGLSLPIRLFAGLARPKRIRILGQELAGEVVEVGEQVTNYQVGDSVYGTTGFKFGAYAEYICLPADPGDAQGVLAPKPENLTYLEAAAVPTAGLEALHYLRKGAAGPGKHVLIIGGGGSIGTYAIQLAKHLGAAVTAVDSTTKQEALRALGADHVIDYTRDDYLTGGKTYDLIIDVVGKHSVARRLKLLKKNGRYFLAFSRLSDILLRLWITLTSKKQLMIEAAAQKKDDLMFLTGLIEAGQLRPVIDRIFHLAQVRGAPLCRSRWKNRKCVYCHHSRSP